MARTKNASNNKSPGNQLLKKCAACEEEKKLINFYMSSNEKIHKDKKVPYCKDCVKSLSSDENGNFDIEKFKQVLMVLDKPFLQDAFESAVMECEKIDSTDYIGKYMKCIALNYKYLTFKDSDGNNLNNTESIQTIKKNEEVIYTKNDEKNKEDVLRMLGYDPFETEYELDKPYLYSRLIDYLDESTLEDSFKLPACIEIVKSFNQIDKINHALSLSTRDVSSIAGNTGGIKSLFDAKEKILKSVLALAKDNGISVNNNNNKSKGAGTLSGIIKQLQEKGIVESDINLFNIQTCDGMRQVADISNASIIQQLVFDENDYTEMIKEQRILIEDYRNKCDKLEEENRLLKIKLQIIQQEGDGE